MDLFLQQGAGKFSFLIEISWKEHLQALLCKLNLSSLQVESGFDGQIIEIDYKYIPRWLHTSSCIRDTCKFMSEHSIHLSNIGPCIKPKIQPDTCLMKHCANIGTPQVNLGLLTNS